uniref:Uncharacterized protein n=1 Tax=Chromera velia CCMP2878 TaxID=1169474 RepID=A0A0G4HM44_9ALVE|eukprot:Cvel_29007.t1-p1 / transcript=Cvel_29007.t1 / gene=Cvel_29007 / organism=Chromera_velia_CCMP2878 / gene_product=hypothetical protein / transcript_product=hypothetical protein / location=Cvel_scaffold3907:1381-3622(+) / protein_length=417 / sequence_SO=supercontig / SO=protein_coding / is_pseudo=false
MKAGSKLNNYLRGELTPDALLTDAGILQGKLVREEVIPSLIKHVGKPFDFVGVSPMKRAIETALASVPEEAYSEPILHILPEIGEERVVPKSMPLFLRAYVNDADNQPSSLEDQMRYFCREAGVHSCLLKPLHYTDLDGTKQSLEVNVKLDFEEYPEMEYYQNSKENFLDRLKHELIPNLIKRKQDAKDAPDNQLPDCLSLYFVSHRGYIVHLMRKFDPQFPSIENTGVVRVSLRYHIGAQKLLMRPGPIRALANVHGHFDWSAGGGGSGVLPQSQASRIVDKSKVPTIIDRTSKNFVSQMNNVIDRCGFTDARVGPRWSKFVLSKDLYCSLDGSCSSEESVEDDFNLRHQEIEMMAYEDFEDPDDFEDPEVMMREPLLKGQGRSSSAKKVKKSQYKKPAKEVRVRISKKSKKGPSS